MMKAKCGSCPFGPNGDPLIANSVLTRVVERWEGTQICHHPILKGKPETHLCRGARDVQLQVLAAFGIITAPTDEAFAAKSRELGVTP